MTQSRPWGPAQEMRLFWGFVVQPFAAAVLGFVAFPLIDLTRRALEGGGAIDPIDASLAVAAGAALAGFFVTVCGAVPAVVWLLRRGPLSLKQTLWSGVILGNVPLAIIIPLNALTRSDGASAASFGPLGLMRALAFGALFGIAGAALFWAIAIRGTTMDRGRRRLVQC